MRTLLELLETQARNHAPRRAFTFLADDGQEQSLTYRELDGRARIIASALSRSTSPGDRALLVFPAGLDFISAFFGCAYAGVLAVPATFPKPRRPMPRLSAIAKDCDPAVVLTSQASLDMLDVESVAPDLAAIRWLATDELSEDGAAWRRPSINGNDLAFLQYTSGSTSDPKGVMVSHANLLHNMTMILHGNGVRSGPGEHAGRTGAFWLPAYHDMGLICGILGTVFEAGHSVLMSPMSFLRRPIAWLQTISKYRAAVSGAPNFAYELCVAKTTQEERAGLDLSSWKVAFCSAEPVRAETLDRFAESFAECGFQAEAFYPCYGLAEATLLAAGGEGPGRPIVKHVERKALAENRLFAANGNGNGNGHAKGNGYTNGHANGHRNGNAHANGNGRMQRLVSCGRALLGQQIVIADPQRRSRVPAGSVGEIWIKGKSVARGYWNRREENERVFAARLEGDDDGPFLRTGDLGFFADEELFVTGRLKDLIIIRGRNHYPQDIEHTVTSAHPALVLGGGAAFSVEEDGEERLVVVQEIDRSQKQADLEDVLRQIRAAVAREHELDVHTVVLIRQASLPRTTSGKPQRNLCRTQFQSGELRGLAEWKAESSPAAPSAIAASPVKKIDESLARPRPGEKLEPGELDRLTERIEAWLLDWLMERGGVPRDLVSRDRPFAEYGLSSLTAVELSQDLETWLGIELSSVIAWKYPTPESLSRYLAGEVGGVSEEQNISLLPPRRRTADEFLRFLEEVEAQENKTTP